MAKRNTITSPSRDTLNAFDDVLGNLEETVACIHAVTWHLDETEGKVRCLDVLERHLAADMAELRKAFGAFYSGGGAR